MTAQCHSRSARPGRVAAVLAGIACLGCCAAPIVVQLGLLTGAGAVAVANGLITAAVVLLAGAAVWHLVRRRRAAIRTGTCGCGTCGAASRPT